MCLWEYTTYVCRCPQGQKKVSDLLQLERPLRTKLRSSGRAKCTCSSLMAPLMRTKGSRAAVCPCSIGCWDRMASHFSPLPSTQVGHAQQTALMMVLKSHPGGCRGEHCPFKEASLETPSMVLVGSSRAPPCLLENASQVVIILASHPAPSKHL